MSKIVKIIILENIVLVALLLLLLFFPKQKSVAKICFKENCFEVEIAKTQPQLQKGLMFRESLDKNKGMLLVFKEEGNYPDWMKNTLITLDIIWINKNQEVVFIKENAEPCKEICLPINPNQNAKYILEINGGLAEEINLKIGDKISIK